MSFGHSPLYARIEVIHFRIMYYNINSDLSVCVDFKRVIIYILIVKAQIAVKMDNLSFMCANDKIHGGKSSTFSFFIHPSSMVKWICFLQAMYILRSAMIQQISFKSL